jgi:hypothetical protein
VAEADLLDKRRALIVGGLLAELIAGNLARRVGCDVDIFERERFFRSLKLRRVTFG